MGKQSQISVVSKNHFTNVLSILCKGFVIKLKIFTSHKIRFQNVCIRYMSILHKFSKQIACRQNILRSTELLWLNVIGIPKTG